MSKSTLIGIASRMVGVPLLVSESKLDILIQVVGGRINLDTRPLATYAQDTMRADRPDYVVQDGVAVIPITGTLVKKGSYMEAASNLVGYDAISRMVQGAVDDTNIRGIVLDIDSHGGEVGGVFELAKIIHEGRDKKPIYAVANDAFSAAYLLASATDKIYVTSTSGVGSIGVVSLHVDESGKDEKEGRKFTYVHAGEQKVLANPHEPLSKDALSVLQGRVDSIYDMFVDAVVVGRGLSAQTIKATEAGLFFGEQAVSQGLADAIGGLDVALRDMRVKQKNYKEKGMSGLEAQAESGVSLADAKVIVNMCGAAGKEAMAGTFIAEGWSVAAVSEKLLELRASADGEDILTHVEVGAGAGFNMEAILFKEVAKLNGSAA